MEMLILANTDDTKENLAKLLRTADENRTGGLYKKVIWDSFRRRGMWKDFTHLGNVDLHIRDSDTDTGEHASPQIHWTSPDIWVRNNPPPADPNDPNDPNYGEHPDDGHQPPINNVPNYLYVNVHNRGSQKALANTFSVEAFHCDPATAMLWPTHFQSMGTQPITVDIPANGGSAGRSIPLDAADRGSRVSVGNRLWCWRSCDPAKLREMSISSCAFRQ
jgi:hypothetical protein